MQHECAHLVKNVKKCQYPIFYVQYFRYIQGAAKKSNPLSYFSNF